MVSNDIKKNSMRGASSESVASSGSLRFRQERRSVAHETSPDAEHAYATGIFRFY